jgi:phospholipid/cholesterol/gamma-HCH transport system substrate-binding protein
VRGTLIRLGIFLVVSAVLGSTIIGTLGGDRTGPTDTYHAMFSDVSGLRVGDPVRVSGVKVGVVTGESLQDASRVDVAFTANHDQTVSSTTFAVVRYANLLGQRFLALTQGADPGTPLRHGATIPVDRTAPALSLTVLFNGFQPLFNALDPTQINALSTEIVQVLQGETGSIDDLLSRTADLTTNLADRDTLFLEVLDGMSSVLQEVSQHDAQLGAMLASLHQLTATLSADSASIGNSLSGVDGLMASVDNLLTGLQSHSFDTDVSDLRSVTGAFAQNQALLDQLVKGFPVAFGDFARITQNGNWVNSYLCGTVLETTGQAALDLKQIAQVAGLPPALVALLKLLPVSIPLFLKVPNGKAGGSSAQTAVCR